MADSAQALMPTTASPAPENWFLKGACRSSDLHADCWFPAEPDERNAKAARKICRGCPVNDHCLNQAQAFPDTVGIWGGLDEKERRNRRRREARRA